MTGLGLGIKGGEGAPAASQSSDGLVAMCGTIAVHKPGEQASQLDWVLNACHRLAGQIFTFEDVVKLQCPEEMFVSTIRQYIYQLAKEGYLRRVGRGYYQWLGQPNSPSGDAASFRFRNLEL